jgi:hypothetical protein
MAVSGRPMFFRCPNNEFEMEESQCSLVNNVSSAVLTVGVENVSYIMQYCIAAKAEFRRKRVFKY